jgi:hypothetical protein
MTPSAQEPVDLIRLHSGVHGRIVAYDCSRPEAEYFAEQFRAAYAAFHAIPQRVLELHWAAVGLSGLLTKAAPSWGRDRGFASVSEDGSASYCWPDVLPKMPPDLLETDLIHELLHMLYKALGEPNHKNKGGNDAEWLVLGTQEALGPDITVVTVWKEVHLELTGGDPQWKTAEQLEEEKTWRPETSRQGVSRMKAKREAACSPRKAYMSIATGSAAMTVEQINKIGLEGLRNLLAKQS